MVGALFALALLSGCYDVETEFIAPGEAMFIPGLSGTFTSDSGDSTELTPLPANEYHYRRTYSDGTVSSGTFRAVRLYDDGGLYALFADYTYDGSNARFRELSVADSEIPPLAASYGVTVDPDSYSVTGPSEQVRAFLLAHRSQHLNRS